MSARDRWAIIALLLLVLLCALAALGNGLFGVGDYQRWTWPGLSALGWLMAAIYRYDLARLRAATGIYP